MDKPIKFKFKELTADNKPIGSFSKKALFDGQQLLLGQTGVPVGAIYRVQKVLHNRLVLYYALESGIGSYPFLVTTGNRDKVAHALNVVASGNLAEKHRRDLSAKQQAGLFRAETCPFCEAVIDLTDLPGSPQAYCPYCDTVFTRQGNAGAEEKRYRICQKCGLYAQPQAFTAFYFYFLLAVWGYYQRTEVLCHACMRKEAWKMLGANFLFLLGLPSALYQLGRSYLGGSALSAIFAGLDGANALVKRKRYDEAVREYEAVAGRQLASAGVRFNQGAAMQRAGNWAEAARYLEQSLRDCTNYAPSYRLLLTAYKSLGKEAQAEALRARWEGSEAPAS